MVTQPTLTPSAIEVASVAYNLAREPGGSIWVTDKQLLVTDQTAGQQATVFRLNSTGTILTALKLPPTKYAIPTPSDIAMQLDMAGTAVLNVWVTDFSEGVVYFFPPTATQTTDIKIVQLPAGSQPVGIIFDSSRQVMWVADQNTNTLYAINVAGTLDTTLSIALNRPLPPGATSLGGPSRLALGADNRIWFVQPGQSRVGVYNPQDKSTKFFTTKSGSPDPSDDNSFYFTDLKFSIDKKKLWAVGNRNNTLWTIDDVTATTPIFKFAVAFPTTVSRPRNLTIDSLGFMWVTFYNNNSIAYLTPEGVVINIISGLTGGAKTDGIIYTDATDDKIWFTDDTARVISFKPAEAATGPGTTALSIAANPSSMNAQRGNPFGTISITVTDTNTKAPVANRTLIIMISDPQIATFTSTPAGPETNTLEITTDANGIANITTLKASSTVQDGATFTLSGRLIRGALSTAFFTGTIGSVVTDIVANNPDNRSTRVNTQFPEPLMASVVGTPPFSPMNITFEISSTSPASFKLGSIDPADKTITVAINTSTGQAMAMIYALNAPGAVVVTAKLTSDPTKTATFNWAVIAVPDGLVWSPTKIGATNGQPVTVPATIILTAGGAPVSQGVVTIMISEPGQANFHKNADPTSTAKIIKLVTDATGQAQIKRISGNPNVAFYLQIENEENIKITAILNDLDVSSPPLSSVLTVVSS